MKRLNFLRILMVLLLFATAACEETVFESAFPIGKETSFISDKLYYSTDGKYNIIINEISDSRCPEGLICIWSGEVTIKGEWVAWGKNSSFEIHSVVSQQNKQPDGFTIQIIDAKPYRKFGVESDPQNLVVIVKIDKVN